MSRGNQGGCCIAMYAGSSPTFASKTQHIMSRYRPIAPKPLVPTENPSDPQTSSSLSVDKGSSKLVPEANTTGRRRSRKRHADHSSSSALTRRHHAKKASVSSLLLAPEKPGRSSLKGTTVSTNKTPRSGKRNESGFLPHSKEVAVALTPILSESVAPVFGPGGLQRLCNERSIDRSSSVEQQHSVLSLATGSLVNDESKRIVEEEEEMPSLRETGIKKDDAAFMKRAAAARSPHDVLPREGSGSGISMQRVRGFSGGFGELFKRLTPVQETMPERGMEIPSSLLSKDTSGCCTALMKSGEYSPRTGGTLIMPLPYASASYGAESEVCSGEDVAESRRTDLVTLSLLPENPLQNGRPLSSSSSPSDSSFVSSSSYARSKFSLPSSSVVHGLRLDCNHDGAINQDTKLTMFFSSRREQQQLEESECWRDSRFCNNKELQKNNPKKFQDTLVTDTFGPVAARAFVEQVRSSSSGRRTHAADSRQDLNGPVVDGYYLDQVYATSSDAVMLTDEHNTILWSNFAFRRAATEKTSGKMQSAGPHIDPLGIPTQLAVLTFQSLYRAAKCKAVLWGFLKKFIFQEVIGPCFSGSKGLRDWKFQAEAHEQSHDSRTASFDASMVLKESVVYEGDLSLGLSPHKVIAPQPMQAVGSTICLECITKVNQLTSPLTGTVEAFQDQLEKLLLPIVNTDSTHKVRWVNTAYKQMVGQTERAWLSSIVGGNPELEAHPPSELAGDVSIVFPGEKPPVDAAEFSCQVHIKWTKSRGENISTLVVPADVIRLDEDRLGPLFVWKFDTFNGSQPLGI